MNRGGRRRVAVTGCGLRSPVGHDADAAERALRRGESGVVPYPAWDHVEGLAGILAAPVRDVGRRALPRRLRRSMGRTALLAELAAADAIDRAGMTEDLLASGRVGVSVASTIGSARATAEFCSELDRESSIRGLRSTTFLRFMGHSAASNIALAHGIRGRTVAPTAACASGNQAIGLAAEAIATGTQDAMIAGGAEELHPTVAATFAVTGALSRRDAATPRPFDRSRDGLVIGEGAGVLVLEELSHARRRGATPLAEVVGFATATAAGHMTEPDPDGMERCIRLALDDAGLAPGEVDYVNAHATGTPQGDAAEAEACRRVFGSGVPVSSTKGATGHTLGAAGAIEAVLCVQAIRKGWLPPTVHLESAGPRCGGLDLVETSRDADVRVAVDHSFAFGGVASVLIFSALPR